MFIRNGAALWAAIFRSPEDGVGVGSPGIENPLSISEAMSRYSPPETDDDNNDQGSAPPAEDAGAPEEESAEEADAAPPEEEARSETNEADPGDNLPSIDPPRSWTKEDKELFKGLPRETQQRLADRERSREADFLRRQNEAAEHAKALQAEHQAAQQARQQYESAIPNLLAALQAQTAQEFQDIKTWDDVAKMADQDPARYLLWDSHVKRHQALQQEALSIEERSRAEQAERLNAFKAEQAKLFLEAAPEYADPVKGPQLQAATRSYLTDEIGVGEDELRGLWAGDQTISLHDHRVQLILRDAQRYRAAQAAVKAAPAKPVPPVQRPGVAQSKGEQRVAHLETLDKRLSKTGSRDAALALMRAQRGR